MKITVAEIERNIQMVEGTLQSRPYPYCGVDAVSPDGSVNEGHADGQVVRAP